MKFGETLYQRSVPEWATYNVNYNEVKDLIKRETTQGIARPVPIPGQGTNPWTQLEDKLFPILKEQHDRTALFLSSKYGELGRRLNYLQKQVRSLQDSLNLQRGRPSAARRYHKLVEDAENVGENIQNLTRFAAVQKTAFRKILKKYRKWTGSDGLKIRFEDEVLVQGKLNLDVGELMQRLALIRTTITGELSGPILRGEQVQSKARKNAEDASEMAPCSALRIAKAAEEGNLQLDAALASTPFGQSAGTATYWIHPDDLEEAHVLVLRFLQLTPNRPQLVRTDSSKSGSSHGSAPWSASEDLCTHVLLCDAIPRFLQDNASNKSSKIAVTARWNRSPRAVATVSEGSAQGLSDRIVDLNRDLLPAAFQAQPPPNDTPRLRSDKGVSLIQQYLAKHQNIKPLAEMHFERSRFTGLRNNKQSGVWATLDTNVIFSPVNESALGATDDDVEQGEAFPHGVLEIRWESCSKPDVVRAFDDTHIAERVHGFSTEYAALQAENDGLPEPSWRHLLGKDIRKVPTKPQGIKSKLGPGVQATSSGASPRPASSTDGADESIFSAKHHISRAESETSPDASVRNSQILSPSAANPAPEHEVLDKKKKARINAKSPSRARQRYYNEYDDPNSELYHQEEYVIYVDPNERFPGAETVSKAFASMYHSLGKGSARLKEWLPLSQTDKHRDQQSADERSPLLAFSRYATENNADDGSSDSDSSGAAVEARTTTQAGHRHRGKGASRRRARPTRRQRSLERTLFVFCTGILILGYLFLLLAAILLGTGRRKVRLEVDAGAIVGVVAAEVCAFLAAFLLFMRRDKVSDLHRGIVIVAIVGLVVIGIGLFVGIIGSVA